MIMYAQASSVPDAVRELLVSNKIYLESIELGIANYTALAARIKPEVESLTGSGVNLNTIVVAIKRFADALEKKHGQDRVSSRAGMKAKMSLTGSMIDVDFQRESDEVANMLEDFFNQETGYSLFQTDNHFSLLAEDAGEIRNLVSTALQRFNGTIKEGLSKINITISPEEPNPYQLLSLISSLLDNHQIPIHSAFFTPSEIVLTLSDKDAAKAYELIRSKIG
jgi:hypothetical protein